MRHFGGLGLGLYLVRQITEAHGGSVTANNTAGGGACITVRLPLEPPNDTVVA
jgi:signal transduction histidine kinase